MKEDSGEVEIDLRAALRRREPDADLTPRILAKLADRQPQRPGSSRQAPRRYIAAALAACLLLAAFLGIRGQRRRGRARQQAAAVADAQQLARALRLAAADLDVVRRQVDRNDPRIRAASRVRMDDERNR